jgi:uncharacterized protein
MNRRLWNLACLSAATPLMATMAGCGAIAPPAMRWYRLPMEPPPGAPASRPQAGAAPVWELAPALPMPEMLERDTLLVEEGAAGIRLLHGHRWAEPLRDTLPRLMQRDLEWWLPGLWPAPAPTAVPVAGRIQVQLLGLLGSLPLQQVRASARWVVTPAPEADAHANANATPRSGRAPPRARQDEIQVPWTGTSAESLVVAQRAALWELAARIAASLDEI